MRKTKIICTLGPACADETTMRAMIDSGMDVARFNFSHGSHESHKELFDTLVRARGDRPIAAILDTRGPEVRLESFEGGKATLVTGQTFTLWAKSRVGDAQGCSTTYPGLCRDLRPGARVLLDDGLLLLRVVHSNAESTECIVENGGPISDKKGVNLPDTVLRLPYLSEQDRNDLLFGIETGFDYVAASFVSCAEDVLQVRYFLNHHGGEEMKIISKIENARGVANIDEIIKHSDAIMVARGDMGVEVALEDVPVLQKILIKQARGTGKQVITATQMLESMTHNPRPTRAEAGDVANAVYDGTSALMLSGETTVGEYPVQAVATMATIARRAEADIDYDQRFRLMETAGADVTDAISHAACTTGMDLAAKAIITVTESGWTAKMISKFRSSVGIIGCTPHQRTYRQINLSWGVTPLIVPPVLNSTDALISLAIQRAGDEGLVNRDDLVVVTAGVPLGQAGTTNMMTVQRVER